MGSEMCIRDRCRRQKCRHPTNQSRTEEWKQVLLLTLGPLAMAAAFPRFPRERNHGTPRRGFGLEPKPLVDRLPPGGAILTPRRLALLCCEMLSRGFHFWCIACFYKNEMKNGRTAAVKKRKKNGRMHVHVRYVCMSCMCSNSVFTCTSQLRGKRKVVHLPEWTPCTLSLIHI